MSSKLQIKSVSVRNFRSVGNQPIVINLTDHATNLVTSNENGAGKSTVVAWGLTYGLFNKAYGDKSTLPKLVNTKNKKNCVVEVEFTTKGIDWKVVRGQKPAIFEIYRNGKLVESETATADLQGYLNNVLGLDFKTACNSMILGKDRFKPFVQMTAPERRAHIEIIMDLVIFGRMDEVSKNDLRDIKREIQDLEHKLALEVSEMKGIASKIELLERQKAEQDQDVSGEIAELIKDTIRLQDTIDKASVKVTELESVIAAGQTAMEHVEKHRGTLRECEFRRQTYSSAVKKFENLSGLATCPECDQEVDGDHAQVIITDNQTRLDKTNQIAEQLQQKIESFRPEVDAGVEAKNKVDALCQGVNRMLVELDQKNKRLEALQAKAQASSDKQAEIDQARKEFDGHKATADEYERQQADAFDRQRIVEQSIIVLKDDGIKSEIIKKYVPYLNERVNHYLSAMNFWLGLVIDESFNITITEPTRAKLGLSDLSTGQMARINLAFLLAFKDIAKLKASVDSNLLVLDETLENLSESGVKDFMEMAKHTLEDTNLWVVSQRSSEFSEHFDHQINYRLHDEFTIAS